MTAAPVGAGAASPTTANSSDGQKAKHPIMLQLEAALNKYGDKRPTFEQKTAEAMGVKSIYDIPPAQLPQALLKVIEHQKAAKAAKAEKAGAAKPKGTAKKKVDLPPPDNREAPDLQEDDTRGDDDGIPV
jgi:hypothetical protein